MAIAKLIAFVVSLATAGCVPSVTWAPDSTGFYFTSHKEELAELRFFEVASRQANGSSGT
jgi:hypothetical protein